MRVCTHAGLQGLRPKLRPRHGLELQARATFGHELADRYKREVRLRIRCTAVAILHADARSLATALRALRLIDTASWLHIDPLSGATPDEALLSHGIEPWQ